MEPDHADVAVPPRSDVVGRMVEGVLDVDDLATSITVGGTGSDAAESWFVGAVKECSDRSTLCTVTSPRFL